MLSDAVLLGIFTTVTGMFGIFMAFMTVRLNKTAEKTHDLVNQQSLTLAKLRVLTSNRLGNEPEDIKEKNDALEALLKKEAEQAEIDSKK